MTAVHADEPTAVTTTTVTEVITVSDNNTAPKPADHKGSNDDRPLRFSWGAYIPGGIELNGHGMSTIGIGAEFGMEWHWVRFFGVTAEADVMVENSSRTFPLAVVFRTDFCNRRRLLFVDLRGGVALNYLNHAPQEQVAYGSASLGINLATGRNFTSYLMLGYTYNGRRECYLGDRLRDCPGMSYATMRLGVSF